MKFFYIYKENKEIIMNLSEVLSIVTIKGLEKIFMHSKGGEHYTIIHKDYQDILNFFTSEAVIMYLQVTDEKLF